MVAGKQDIRDLKQWVCWRSEERDGRPTKIPYDPLSGERAVGYLGRLTVALLGAPAHPLL